MGHVQIVSGLQTIQLWNMFRPVQWSQPGENEMKLMTISRHLHPDTEFTC